MSSFSKLMTYDNYEMKKNTTEHKKKMHSEAISKRSYLQQCPICKTYEDFITNVHCVKEHGMTKKEIEAIHGKIVAGNSKTNKK